MPRCVLPCQNRNIVLIFIVIVIRLPPPSPAQQVEQRRLGIPKGTPVAVQQW